ncbi:MAG: 50S ribosomal protein L19 [Candidatus Shikimatogenerans bostrichidophilus]|nr:MAG: 50S ribosomal protein L19 [Candidatus Shikimatogenerans bostrichidophilus]
MNNNKLIKYLELKYINKTNINYKFNVGDNISVYYENIQKDNFKTKNKLLIFTGYVISKKGDNKFNKTFIIRKIINNIGVEIIFYLYSPYIKDIIINNKGKIRKSKLYYLRNSNKKIKNRDS